MKKKKLLTFKKKETSLSEELDNFSTDPKYQRNGVNVSFYSFFRLYREMEAMWTRHFFPNLLDVHRRNGIQADMQMLLIPVFHSKPRGLSPLTRAPSATIKALAPPT